MELNQEQKAKVAEWVSGGMKLAEVQRQLDEQFGISMTFMDVRFMVDDLDLELQDTPQPKAAEPKPEAAPEAFPGSEPAAADIPADAGAEVVEDFFGDEPSPTGSGGVSVSVDAVQRPGSMVSGKVTFSDGKTCDWQVDQFGRLGVIPSEEGYQPPANDLPEFQLMLEQELRNKGF